MAEAIEKHFRSLGELADFLGQADTKKHSHMTGGRNKFYGATWGQAMDMLVHGHKPGAAKIAELADRIKHLEREENPTYQWDVTGDLFDVGTMLTGQPEYWLASDPGNNRRIYRLLVNIGMFGGISPKRIANRGAALVALIDRLQQDPSSIVELSVFSYCMAVGDKRIPVKIFIDMGTTPIDLDATAFVLAHAGFFRRLLFVAREILIGTTDSSYYTGMGPTGELNQASLPEGTTYFHGGSKHHLDVVERNFDTLRNAADWINRTVKALAEAA